jgi:VWFA-related protein
MAIAMAPRVAPSQSNAAPQAPTPAATPPADSDAEVIRVETNLVNTFFTAVDRDHHFLTSLRAEDVSVSEDGVIQKVSLFERETERPLSVVLLIDTSDSQRGILQDEKSAAEKFVDSVVRPDRDRAAIVSFTGAPKVEQQPTNNLAKLHDAIKRVRIEISAENARRIANGEDRLPKDQDPSGYTGIWDAMWMVVSNLLEKSPEGTRRAVVLLSDGDDTSSSVKRSEVINLAIKSDVAIYAIGMRDQNFPEGKLDSGALRKITDNTGGRAFFPHQPNELQAAFKQIELELRSQYLIAYSPSNKNRDGSYRRVRIEIVNPELRKNKAQLLYREGYYAKKS